MIGDGMRITVGERYLIALSKDTETYAFRSAPLGDWFRIAQNGDVVPLGSALLRKRLFATKKISEIEAAARRGR
jgi:hypothetical protein